jgi:hypothetical protein
MFTGLGPAESGKSDNNWQPGEPTVAKNTIFNLARTYGFLTGYYYSKEKLGFLVNPSVGDHRFTKDNAVGIAHPFIQKPGNHFVFLHVSGLDEVGPVKGWLSPEYLEELSFIDDMLGALIDTVRQKGDYLIVITSDHAGRGTVHGSPLGGTASNRKCQRTGCRRKTGRPQAEDRNSRFSQSRGGPAGKNPGVFQGNRPVFRHHHGPQYRFRRSDHRCRWSWKQTTRKGKYRDFGQTIEIITGVSPQDRVIVNPSDSLLNGMTVAVSEAAPAEKKP